MHPETGRLSPHPGAAVARQASDQANHYFTPPMDTKDLQAERDHLVKKVIIKLQERGYEKILADKPGFTAPKKIKWESTNEGFVPDVVGLKNGLKIFDIVTPTILEEKETLERCRLFSVYAKRNNAIFYIVFPAGVLEQVKKKLQGSGLRAQLWEI